MRYPGLGHVGVRKFNGISYSVNKARAYSRRSDADKEAKRLQRTGASTRVVKTSQGYGVWFTWK